jgi:hypothetical protein
VNYGKIETKLKNWITFGDYKLVVGGGERLCWDNLHDFESELERES